MKTFLDTETTGLICKLPPKPGKGGFKWPRLSETLEFLKITPEEVLEKTLELFGETNGFHDSRFDTTSVLMIYEKYEENWGDER